MPPIWVQYGHAAKESGDLPAAGGAYRRALDLRPGFADGHLQLGHALKRQGQTAAALESYVRAAGLAAEDPEYQMQLGHALNGMGRRVAAVEAFRRALSLAPGRADAALELGHALLALGEPVGALEAFRQAVRLAPEQPAGTWMQHGHAARAAGELAAAEAAYRRALELAPDQGDTHLHLGHVLRESRQEAAALAAYGRAVELAPEDAAARRLLGEALLEAGRPEAAADAFARVAALAPGEVGGHLALAGVLAGLGQMEAALAPLDRSAGVSLDAVRWAMRPYYYLGRNRALTRLSSGQPFFVHTADRGISPWIIMGGVWETFVDDVLCTLLRPADVFLDVGANMGYYTVKAGSIVGPQGRVFAFEPNPDLFPVLLDNIDINGFNGRVTPFALAAGAEAGSSRLRVNPTNMGGGWVAAPGSPGASAPDGLRIDIERVDALLPPGTVADVVKIDTEGFEPLVLRGMAETLARSPSCALVVEISLLQWRQYGDPFAILAQLTESRRLFLIPHQGALVPQTVAQLREAVTPDFVSYVAMVPEGPRLDAIARLL